MSSEQKCNFGMIGFDTMDQNLIPNFDNHNFAGAGYDQDVCRESGTKRGCDKQVYFVMKPILEAIDAKFTDSPCITYTG
jgi:6-phosphogluconate dehydrogenase